MDRLQITKEVNQPDQGGPANPSPVLETSQLISIPARPEARQNVAGGPPAHGWEPSGFGEGGCGESVDVPPQPRGASVRASGFFGESFPAPRRGASY